MAVRFTVESHSKNSISLGCNHAMLTKEIEYFIAEKQRKALHDRLLAGYQANAAADVEIATEWSSLEDEAWRNHIPTDVTEDITNDSINSLTNSAW